ncbi:MAG TPA: methyltransferase domain-containing protein [Pseudomonadota bacterium]|nr:methyltransferase domain-containing protein [Pseudomonadota bacterium]
MSAKTSSRKKKTPASSPKTSGKRSGLTLAVPPTDADENPIAELEDAAVHLAPPDLPHSTEPAAVASDAEAGPQDVPPVPVPETVAPSAEPTPVSLIGAEAAQPEVPTETATPPETNPTAGSEQDLLAAAPRPPQEAPVVAGPVDAWLQAVGRALPIHDWAFTALRTLTARKQLLGAIDLLLPPSGRILDIGGGAGLFATYLAGSAPARHITALQSQASLLRRAERLAAELGLSNVSFVLGEPLSAAVEGEFDAIYAIDALHRLPPSQLIPTLRDLAGRLRPGGVLVVKEISSATYIGPSLTQLLERVLASDGQAGSALSAAYRHHDEWLGLLADAGLMPRLGHVPDLLQPHILLTATRAG